MDKGYEKERFTCLSIKVSIAKKYRRFCRIQGQSQSMALLAMVNYFEANGVSPEDRLDETIASLKYQMKRRFNALVAIVRSIEKEQTKPTVAMLQSLFEQHLKGEADEFGEEVMEFIERKFEDGPPDETWDEETTVPRVRYERLEERMVALKADFSHVLDRVKVVKPSFGKEYLKLELTMAEIEKYRRNIENS